MLWLAFCWVRQEGFSKKIAKGGYPAHFGGTKFNCVWEKEMFLTEPEDVG
jgi:hypothetical protein